MINSQHKKASWLQAMLKQSLGVAGLGTMIALAGCSGVISGAGPYRSDIETKSDLYNLVEISPTTLAPYMLQPLKSQASLVSVPWIPPVRLMGGDQLDVLITDNAPEGAGLFAPLSAGGTKLTTRIDTNGMISLPYVGRERVLGMTLTQVEDLITRKLKGVTSDVQAHVELIGDMSGSVLVAGAVKTPGRFSTLTSPLTLIDAINQAGGPVLEPYLVDVTVRVGSSVTTVGYEDVLAGRNVRLQPNSEVILERAKRRFVAMGAVGTPGIHDLPAKNASLLDALGTVGGLKEGSANPSGVFVFRLADPVDGQRPKATVLHIDMRDPAAIFYAKQVMLSPDDTVYVTNAAVYETQKIISPIVQTLVLGRTVNGL